MPRYPNLLAVHSKIMAATIKINTFLGGDLMNELDKISVSCFEQQSQWTCNTKPLQEFTGHNRQQFHRQSQLMCLWEVVGFLLPWFLMDILYVALPVACLSLVHSVHALVSALRFSLNTSLLPLLYFSLHVFIANILSSALQGCGFLALQGLARKQPVTSLLCLRKTSY